MVKYKNQRDKELINKSGRNGPVTKKGTTHAQSKLIIFKDLEVSIL
jgi:hypothetical protein